MKIVISKHFPPKGYAAITLVWWLIVRYGVTITQTLVNHEEVHAKQQKEMLLLPFFVWYGLEFLVRLIQYRNWNKAYRNISFEREAYSNEYDYFYLTKRKRFAWFHYLNKNSNED